jgi:hypothetical protein
MPQPRERTLRTSPRYASICATVSAHLAMAMMDETSTTD